MLPILHHYEASPFAELVRAAFGLKGMAWGSVIVPNVLPKPGQTELTGGYARTPVVQIGADIYCDTGAILPALEALRPEPSLYPAPLGPLHRMIASWAGGAQFMAHVGAAMGNMPAEAMGEAFIKDRQARFGLDMGQLAKATPHLAGQALVAWDWTSQALADGRPFIGGDAPGAGDLGLYCDFWFVRAVPFARDTAARILALPGIADWAARMAALGHGERREMTADEAIAVAAAAEPAAITGTVEAPFSAGQAVAVTSEGARDAPTRGQLTRFDSGGITLLRDSDRAGRVAVHFPRLGQVVTPA